MRILGIDPGLRCTGLASYFDGEWCVRSIRPPALPLASRVQVIAAQVETLPLVLYERVVIEKPQVYQGCLQKGDPNDLIDLAVLVGVLRGLFHGPVLLPRPCEWKGQVPKEIHHRRIRARVPELGRQSKDALDAVGLCLWGVDHA